MPGGYKQIKGGDGNTFSKDNQPKNRRKSTKFLTDMLIKGLNKKTEIQVEGILPDGSKAIVKVKMPNKEVVMQALLRQAAKGNVPAIKEILDRTEGKVMEKLEVTTPKVGMDAAQEELYE